MISALEALRDALYKSTTLLLLLLLLTDIVAGTNFPTDHDDQRHISISITAKIAASSLRLEPMGKSGRSLPLSSSAMLRLLWSLGNIVPGT